MPCYLGQYALRIVNHIAILESQHTESCARQETISSVVADLRCIMVMSSTVKLDRQAFARAEEVQDVRAHAMLAAELPACQLASLKMLPERCFGGSQALAQLRSKLSRAW